MNGYAKTILISFLLKLRCDGIKRNRKSREMICNENILVFQRKHSTLLSSEHTTKRNSVLLEYRTEYDDFHMIQDFQSILIGIYDELDDETRQLYGFIRYSEKKFVVLIIGSEQDIDLQKYHTLS